MNWRAWNEAELARMLVAHHNGIADELQRRLDAMRPKLGQFIDCEGHPYVSEYEQNVTKMIAGHRELARRASR